MSHIQMCTSRLTCLHFCFLTLYRATHGATDLAHSQSGQGAGLLLPRQQGHDLHRRKRGQSQ